MPQTLGIVASHKNNAWWDAWGAAYERALAGVRQAHIVLFGDSVSQGFFGDAPYYQNSFGGRIGSLLATRTGVTAGSGVIPAHEEFEVTDARTSRTGTWTAFTGGFFSQGRSASSSATFVLGPVTCSAFKITYATESDGGAWTATVDSGTPANYTSNGATGITTVEIDAGGSGSHTLTITATNKCYLVAVEAIASPTSGVKVSRIARSSQEASALIADADAKSSLRAMRSLAADLVIVEFGLNEAFAGTSTATFEANLSTIVDEAVGIGASVLILAAAPPNPSFIAAATWNNYRTSMATVAATKKVGFIDMADYWTSYAANTPYYFDNQHPGPAGHADMARILSTFVVETVAPSTPSTFMPTDISNLALWLDADDDASFTYSSGTLVSQWNDKSGNLRHFTQGTATNQPTRSASINGRGAVWFDGVDNHMTAGDTLDLGTSSLSIFAVVKRHVTGANHTFLGKYKASSAAGSYLILFINTNDVQTAYNAGSLVGATSAVSTSVDSRIITGIIDRAAGTIAQRINQASDGSNTFTADSASSRNISQELRMGGLRDSADTGFVASYWLNAYVAEVVIYLKAVNSTERDQVETYLASKWGIT